MALPEVKATRVSVLFEVEMFPPNEFGPELMSEADKMFDPPRPDKGGRG